MQKYIQMTCSELCWNYYTTVWGEKEFNEWRNWLKSFYNKDTYSGACNMALYEAIKDWTWEDVLNEYRKYKDCRGDVATFTYSFDNVTRYNAIIDMIIDTMVDDAWQSDDTDSGDALETDTRSQIIELES